MLYLKPRRPTPPPPLPRESMHYLDVAFLMQHLRGQGCTLADISRLTGTTMQQVTDRMRLLELDEGLRGYLRREGMPERIALALLMLPDVVTRRRIAHQITRERLCIRDALLLVTSARRRCRWQRWEASQGQQVRPVIRDIRLYRNAVRDIAGQMTTAGVCATFTERRIGSRMELTIAYPLRQRRTQRYQSM